MGRQGRISIGWVQVANSPLPTFSFFYQMSALSRKAVVITTQSKSSPRLHKDIATHNNARQRTKMVTNWLHFFVTLYVNRVCSSSSSFWAFYFNNHLIKLINLGTARGFNKPNLNCTQARI
jgi:hypothetical protein